uniref:Putative peptidase n=1 Tax=viral metagenome TaxID=1070528 RepID=A0A6M3JHB4_9ZZZZ
MISLSLLAAILLMVVGAFITLFLHEGSHALVAIAQGRRVTSFRPYPHYFMGSLYLGFTSVSPVVINVTNGERLAYFAAPAVKAPLMVVLWSIIGLWPLAIWEGVDLIWWWLGWFRVRPFSDGKNSDGWKVRQLL